MSRLESVGAWRFYQDMLRDMTSVVTEDAESERELLEVRERVRAYQDRYDVPTEQLR
jgi:hypothetical protein